MYLSPEGYTIIDAFKTYQHSLHAHLDPVL